MPLAYYQILAMLVRRPGADAADERPGRDHPELAEPALARGHPARAARLDPAPALLGRPAQHLGHADRRRLRRAGRRRPGTRAQRCASTCSTGCPASRCGSCRPSAGRCWPGWRWSRTRRLGCRRRSPARLPDLSVTDSVALCDHRPFGSGGSHAVRRGHGGHGRAARGRAERLHGGRGRQRRWPTAARSRRRRRPVRIRGPVRSATREGRFGLVPPSGWVVDTSGASGTAALFLEPEADPDGGRQLHRQHQRADRAERGRADGHGARRPAGGDLGAGLPARRGRAVRAGRRHPGAPARRPVRRSRPASRCATSSCSRCAATARSWSPEPRRPTPGTSTRRSSTPPCTR